MASTTDNRKYTGDGTDLRRHQILASVIGPVAASAKLFSGALAGQLLTDTANDPALLDYVADGTMRCVGFCTVSVDLTGLAAGARPTNVLAQTGNLVDKNAGGGSAITAADVGKPAYGCDNQTCSKLPTDGPCVGMITRIDRATGNPVVLVDPMIATMFGRMSAALGTPDCIPVLLVRHSNASVAARFTPGFAGKIRKISASVVDPATTGSKLATFAPSIGGTPVTGGLLALTSANCTPVGAKIDGSAITALNTFKAGDEITIVASSVTAFAEGQVVIYLFIDAST